MESAPPTKPFSGHDAHALIVVDANAFWTASLFGECARFADVLLMKPRDLRAARALWGRWRGDPRPRQMAPRLWEQRLTMMPGWLHTLWPLSERRLARAVRTFAGERSLLLVLTFPQYRGLANRLGPDDRIVYYNYDDYRSNWPRYADRLPLWESELVNRSDVTICISAYRANELRNKNARAATRIHHLPLGSTPDTAEGGAVPRAHLPAGICRPIAGYIGALNARFDFDFIATVAAQLPNVSFVLGGRPPSERDGDLPWRNGLARARRLANVHFIGWVDRHELNGYLRLFDVLLMCYARSDFNRSASPAKLWDYMAIGTPIVANAENPETLMWREVVQIAESPGDYARAIVAALKGDAPGMQSRRRDTARAHTWEQLSLRLERILAAGR